MTNMIAICGRSATGKDTILNEILSRYSDKFVKIKQMTTRSERKGEEDSYNFVDVDTFLNTPMAEKTIFRGWHYGTSEEELLKETARWKIGIYNPEGLRQLQAYKGLGIRLRIYLITCPSRERIIRSIKRASTEEDIAEVMRRYAADNQDFARFLIDFPSSIVYKNESKEDFERIVHSIGGQQIF